MGGEQSRPGTHRIAPPVVVTPAAPPPGRLYCTPEDMLALMAAGGPGLMSPWLSPALGGEGEAPLAQMVHAQQIRCDAVLSPDSLRLQADPGAAGRLLLSFDFASHAPVEAAVTYLCICRRSPTDPSPLALLSRLPRSPLRHCFPTGPQHHFSQLLLAQGAAGWNVMPRASAQAALQAAEAGSGLQALEGGLELPQVTLQELTNRPSAFAGCGDLLPPPRPAPAASASSASASSSSSPALASALDAASLASLEIPPDMCPVLITLTVLDQEGQPVVPTRLQATLCCLAPDSTQPSGWRASVLVQLFQAGAQVYKTQTLFGDSDAAPRAAGAAAEAGGGGGNGGGGGSSSSSSSSSAASTALDEGLINGSDCVICLCEPRTTALLPCRHLCLCAPCAQQLRFQSNKCPICRSPTTSLLTWGN